MKDHNLFHTSRLVFQKANPEKDNRPEIYGQTTKENIHELETEVKATLAGKEKGMKKIDSTTLLVLLSQTQDTEVLTFCSIHESHHVRGEVAGNRNTPYPILAKLAKDKVSEVRASVASNSSAPTNILSELALDPNNHVRLVIAMNKSTPVKSLEILSKDEIANIRHFAIQTLQIVRRKQYERNRILNNIEKHS